MMISITKAVVEGRMSVRGYIGLNVHGVYDGNDEMIIRIRI